jgi:hypothetical protein
VTQLHAVFDGPPCELMKALDAMSDITSSILFLSSCNVSLDTALQKGSRGSIFVKLYGARWLNIHRLDCCILNHKKKRFEFNSPKDWLKHSDNMCPRAINPRGHIAKNSKYIYIHPDHRYMLYFFVRTFVDSFHENISVCTRHGPRGFAQ